MTTYRSKTVYTAAPIDPSNTTEQGLIVLTDQNGMPAFTGTQDQIDAQFERVA